MVTFRLTDGSYIATFLRIGFSVVKVGSSSVQGSFASNSCGWGLKIGDMEIAGRGTSVS